MRFECTTQHVTWDGAARALQWHTGYSAATMHTSAASWSLDSLVGDGGGIQILLSKHVLAR
eukprot:10093243-Heterocapsa_arctica.AAC.1